MVKQNSQFQNDPNIGDPLHEQNSGNSGRKYLKTTEDKDDTPFELAAVILSWIIVVVAFPISVFLCLVIVAEFHRLVVFRLGRVRKGARGPGLVWTLPCIDTYLYVDLRTNVEMIPSQDVLTKDSVTVNIDAAVFYCIDSALHATLQISNVHQSTIFIAQTALRNIVGAKTLHELLTSRESLSIDVRIAVTHACAKWGVRVERVDIKEISLPEMLQRSLASEAEALRNARAKIISAEGELNASRALREASDVMAQNKITLQLRHLQILTSIAQERRVKIIYPFPMEMMTPFEGGNRKKAGANALPFGPFFPFIRPVIENSFKSEPTSESRLPRLTVIEEEPQTSRQALTSRVSRTRELQ